MQGSWIIFKIYLKLTHGGKSIQNLNILSSETHFINKYISVVYSRVYYAAGQKT